MQRRSFLGLGVTAGLASTTRVRGSEVQSSAHHFGRAKQVLVILEQGGLSHMDTWDPKPEAPVEHRSPFKVIDTNAPGVQLTELFAKTARHADKLAIVRSMTHLLTGHDQGTAYMLQGAPPGGPMEIPDLGTSVAHLIGTSCSYLPPYVMVPGNGEQSYNSKNGFLSASLKVFRTGGRNLSDPKWRVNDLRIMDGVDVQRFRDRKSLLSNLDVGLMPTGLSRSADAMGSFFERAYNMLDNPRTQAAFDLKQESEAVRETYGSGHRGQCYLLGRRLIEAGTRFVVLDVREPETASTPGGFNMNWDHHDWIYTNGSCGTIRDKAGGEGRYGIATWVMMGSTDQAFAALLEDLQDRGLLKDTLVCFVTEFGRTPRINQFQGRDHWPHAYSIAFAGAGVRGGQVIGKTDREGGYVVDQAFRPEDYAATIFESLGVDRSIPVYTPDNRPVFLTAEGRPISQLF